MDRFKLYSLIEREFKIGHYDECIHCKQESKYCPNPAYCHTCDVCGHKGSSSDLKTSWEKDRILEMLEVVL